MATYGINVYSSNNTPADMEAVKRILDGAGVKVFDFNPDSSQIFVDSAQVLEAVQTLDAAGFITDEDE
jgi:hypothetical protein